MLTLPSAFIGAAGAAAATGLLTLHLSSTPSDNALSGGETSASTANAAVPGQGGTGKGRAGNGNGNGNNSDNGLTFIIAGVVDGLHPGSQLPLRLAVTNTNAQTIRVNDLSATLLSVTPAAGKSCAPSSANLVVGIRRGDSFDVARGATVTDPGFIPITMPVSADTGCQGARFTLSYKGTAGATS